MIIIIWGANRPYSQLRAELRRTRLQRVREAGMQGRLWLPATSTHYMTTEHSQRSKVFDFSRGRKTGCSGKPLWHNREPSHNSTHIHDIWPWPGSPWWEVSALRTSQLCHHYENMNGSFHLKYLAYSETLCINSRSFRDPVVGFVHGDLPQLLHSISNSCTE